VKLKTVYFDLGNVLIFFSLPKLFSNLSLCTGISSAEVEKFFFHTDLRERYEKGLIGTEGLYQKFLKRAPKTFSLEEFTSAFSDIFTPNLEIWPLVEHLKQKGIRLVLLSNTSECHFKFAETHYPVLKLFDHKVLSFQVGAWKPDQLIFQHALQYAHCAPEECFYIDDIPEFIETARKTGLPGEIFTDVPKLQQQLALRLI
jgi:HAD superfamily hydrolase (TIGR01509 family)